MPTRWKMTITNEIVKQSLAQFGITGSIRLIGNSLDYSYRVKTSDDRVFALRISSGIPIRDVSAFAVEAEWIDEMFGNCWCRVPKLQRTASGERISQVHDDEGLARASTLLAWIQGKRVYRIGTKLARALGHASAALHLSAQNRTNPSAKAIKTWDGTFMCGVRSKDALHQFAPEAVSLVERTHHHMLEVYGSLDPGEIGLINADVGLHNIVWHQGRAGLIDFNDAGIGAYAFCLGRLTERIRRLDNGTKLTEELLRGYREVTPLPPAYERWGPLFEVTAAVFAMKFRQTRVDERGTELSDREKIAIHTCNEKLDLLNL
jgi:Ser/Thr protein kinase RdoA (MazF antagonist)